MCAVEMSENTLLGRVFTKMVETGLITKEQLEAAEEHCAKTGKPLKEVIPSIALVTPEDMGSFLEEQLDVPRVDLENYMTEPEALKALPAEVAREHGILPLFEIEGMLTVVLADPLDVFELDALSKEIGLSLEPALSAGGDVYETIEECYGAQAEPQPQSDEEEESASLDDDIEPLPDFDDLPVMEVSSSADGIDLDALAVADDETVKSLIAHIVNAAAAKDASAVHIEPRKQLFHLFFRIGGEMTEIASAASALESRLVARLLKMARLEGSNDRGVRNGDLSLIVDERERQVAISVCTTSAGARVVIDLKERMAAPLPVGLLGMDAETASRLGALLRLPSGLILVGGPLCSGKTTTLFSCLDALTSETKTIFAVTESVEYAEDGINQIVIGSDPSYSFPSVLRSLREQDWDGLGVDEIRELEVASLVAKSGQSGLTLAATLARDSSAAPSGLIWMGLEPVSLAGVVAGVVSQIPIRLLCDDCKVEDTSEQAQKAMEQLGAPTACVGAGCEKCGGTGYSGREFLYEVLVVDDGIRRAVAVDKPEGDIRSLAKEAGMTTMRQAGLKKAAEGRTSVAEVRRATRHGGG